MPILLLPVPNSLPSYRNLSVHICTERERGEREGGREGGRKGERERGVEGGREGGRPTDYRIPLELCPPKHN